MIDVVRQSVRDAIRQAPFQPQALDQGDIWKQIKDNPDKILGFVSSVTQYSGDELLKEVSSYVRAMKARYGQ